MNKLISEIRDLEARMEKLGHRLDAAKTIEEVRSIEPEINEVSQDLKLKRNKLYSLQGQAGQEGYEGRSGHSQPIGRLNVLGSYNYGNRQTENQHQRSEGIMPDKNDIFSSPEYRSAFYKTLLGQELVDGEKEVYARALDIAKAERRADAFSTTTSAAAVLPTETLDQIIVKARQMGGLISVCRNFAIPTNLTVPIATPSGKAAWHVEGSLVTAEDAAANMGKVSFSGYEILKVFSLSAAAKQMSISAFESYIIDELNASTMQTIADSLVNGTGSDQGTGVLSGITWDATNSLTFPLAGLPSYDNFTKMLSMLKRGYNAGAAFAMNNATFYNNVYGIKDSMGRPIFMNDPQKGDGGYILGKPCVIDDFFPDNVILLGNFNYMGFNIPQGIMIEVSRESSFKSGLIDYRALAIADTKPLVNEAFVKLSMATA